MDKQEEEEKITRMTLQQNSELGDFANDIERGLATKSKYVHPKYLYDKVGSQLFEQICLQPEYYLTRTEASILDKYAPVISKLAGSNVKIIELGSGMQLKNNYSAQSLSITEKEDSYYFPIDVSRAY